MLVEQENHNINNKSNQEPDIWSLYLFALKSPVTREEYKTRLDKFFNFIGLEGNTVEEKSHSFIERYRTVGSQWVFNSILKFIDTQASILANYLYSKEDIENFFTSDNGQKEDYTLEESICRPLIGKQKDKPYFLYCKICPKVENINLASVENHIRLKDHEKHKAKLLELLDKEKRKKKSN